MKGFVYLAVVCTALVGCTSTKNDNNSSEVSASSALSNEEFKLPYEAIQDTEWVSSPASPNPKTGPIKKGDRVMFARDPDPNIPPSWVAAKLNDGSIRYVRPHHFKKV